MSEDATRPTTPSPNSEPEPKIKDSTDDLRQGLDEIRQNYDSLRQGLDEIRQSQDDFRQEIKDSMDDFKRTIRWGVGIIIVMWVGFFLALHYLQLQVFFELILPMTQQ